MCQQSLNFTYAFNGYQQKCKWLHFSWATLYHSTAFPTRYNRSYMLPVLGCGTAASVNSSARVRLAGYVALTLVTFDKQSNGVDSKSNRVIYNDHISFYVTARHIT